MRSRPKKPFQASEVQHKDGAPSTPKSEKWKLFGWQPQGGTNRTNAYYPNLELFKSLAKALEIGEPNWWKHEGDIFVPESRTILSKSPDKFARQTLEGNLEDKPSEEGCPVKRGENGSNVSDRLCQV
jgi:hypothetical protein